MAFSTGFSKSIFSSVTFWGSVLAAVAAAFPALSAQFGLTTANTAVDAQYITAAVAFVVTVYGRFTAKQVVTLTGGPTPPATSLTGTKG
jgi:NO-binding membrane sensor protein with MHYT domain